MAGTVSVCVKDAEAGRVVVGEVEAAEDAQSDSAVKR